MHAFSLYTINFYTRASSYFGLENNERRKGCVSR